mmetsp:Transcript_11315/g.45824  ORF Transcript_11315/g.45824 Transcript_11315/m.45824 type:complete len:780 (-) Transcript_11315:430-2769(-)
MAKKEKATKPFKASPVASWALLLNPLAWLLWTLDFLVWLLTLVGPIATLRWLVRGKYSVATETAVRRKKPAELVTSAVAGKEIRTVPDLVDYVADAFGSIPAMGTRTFLGDYTPEGARFPLKKFGETTWITFAELKERAQCFGAALVADCGMKPLPPGADVETVKGPHTLLMFEDTSAVWMTAALGAAYYSLVVATSYATLGIESVAEAVNDSTVPVVVTNRRQVDAVAALGGRAKCPSLKFVCYTELNVAPADQTAVAPTINGVATIAFEALVSKGAALSPKPELPPPLPEAVALIMYTSGSTGKPKGVMIKHLSICSSVGGLSDVISQMATPGDCYLGYLPQAHILEFCAELTCLRLGVKIGYADPRSLSSTGAVRERPDGTLNTKAGYPYPPGAIQEFRPAFMAGVPKIWDILKKSFEDNVAKMSPVKKMLFEIAYVGRAAALRQHREAPLLKALVFSKLKAMLGGNLKATVSGGGAIASEVQTFVRTAFAAPAVQGYALTETTCSATFQAPDPSNVDGVAGAPLPSVEIKLESVDITDAHNKPYRSTDTSHLGAPCEGRGEILIRGPPLSVGYFKQPDKTAEVFADDGWFHTGDVGVWRPDGQLKIVDRLKNLVKLKGGEYIAIEHMEKEYATCAYVSQANGGVLCYGDHEMDRPIALCVVDEKKLMGWADAQPAAVASMPFVDLCKSSPEANAEVLKALQKAGKSGNLGSNEILAGVMLLPGTAAVDLVPPSYESPWTPENGMLTASNKLNRKAIIQTYGAAGAFDKLKAKGIK